MTDDAERGSVLIVDDAPDNLRLLVEVLKRGGLIPRPVTSGRLAIEAALSDPPDLVLLDMTMPEMSGVEVCRRFQEVDRLRSIPVIFISGRQGPEDKAEAFLAGGVDYVSKPFQVPEVLARIQTHLRIRRLQAEQVSLRAEIEQRIEATTTFQLATLFTIIKIARASDGAPGHPVDRVQGIARAMADFWDVLIAKRADRPAYSHQDACRMIEAGSGTHFDPDVVTAFRILDGQVGRGPREG